MCRQDASWHSAAAELSEENKGKGSNGGGKDESVDAGFEARMFGTLNVQVEQQKIQNATRDENQQLESMEEQGEGEEQDQSEQRGQRVSRTLRQLSDHLSGKQHL